MTPDGDSRGHADLGWPDPEHGPHLLRLRFAEVAGRYACVTVEAVDNAFPLTPTTLKNVGKEITATLARRHNALREIVKHAPPEVAQRAQAQLPELAPAPGKGGRPRTIDDATWQQISEVIAAAYADGVPVTAALRRRWPGRQPATYRKWKQRAAQRTAQTATDKEQGS